MSGTQPLPEPRRATYQDVLDAPPHVVAEILDGALFLSPRPAFPHALACSEIGADVLGSFRRRPKGGAPGGWWILFEPELHFAEHVVVPDLAGWRRERMPVVPRAPFSTLAPDWVCEVLSPSTCSADRVLKTRIYATAGVAWLWMVDPLAKTLEVFQLHDDHWLLVQAVAGNETVRAKPFDAVELDMERWWIPEDEQGSAEAAVPEDAPAPEPG